MFRSIQTIGHYLNKTVHQAIDYTKEVIRLSEEEAEEILIRIEENKKRNLLLKQRPEPKPKPKKAIPIPLTAKMKRHQAAVRYQPKPTTCNILRTLFCCGKKKSAPLSITTEASTEPVQIEKSIAQPKKPKRRQIKARKSSVSAKKQKSFKPVIHKINQINIEEIKPLLITENKTQVPQEAACPSQDVQLPPSQTTSPTQAGIDEAKPINLNVSNDQQTPSMLDPQASSIITTQFAEIKTDNSSTIQLAETKADYSASSQLTEKKVELSLPTQTAETKTEFSSTIPPTETKAELSAPIQLAETKPDSQTPASVRQQLNPHADVFVPEAELTTTGLLQNTSMPLTMSAVVTPLPLIYYVPVPVYVYPESQFVLTPPVDQQQQLFNPSLGF